MAFDFQGTTPCDQEVLEAMEPYWKEFCGNNDLHDPEQNVYCGAMILSYLMDRCKGNYSCALSAYNVGFYGDRWQAGKRYIAKIDRNVVKLQSLML